MRYKKFFVAMLLVAILTSAASLIPPLFLQLWGREQAGLSPQRILMILGIMLLSHALGVLFVVYRERFAKEYNKQNLRGMTRAILRTDYDTLIAQGPTNLFNQAAMSVNSIYSFMTGDNIHIWSSLFVMTVSLALIAVMNPLVALILFFMVPFNYFGYQLLNRSLARRSTAMQQDTSVGFQAIISRLQQIDYLKQCPDHAPFISSLEPMLEKIYGSMARVNVFAQSVSYVFRGINTMAHSLALIYMVYLFTLKTASPLSLILFTILLPLYFDSIGVLTRVNLSRSNFDVALDFQRSLNQQAEDISKNGLSGIDSLDLDVHSLCVPGHTLPFLASAHLKKGDIARVMGKSGSGKSSFAKALLGFRALDGAHYNCMPISQISAASIREHAEYLSQEVAVIKGSLRDNLFFNKPYTPEAEAWLLQEPILQSLFESKTLDSGIHEGGANLSGGEKQKIALARALMSHQDLLVLDEVCSNIDHASAMDIYRRIDADRDSRITLIISHDELPEGLANIVLNGEETDDGAIRSPQTADSSSHHDHLP